MDKEALKDWRSGHKLSQSELAERLQVSVRTLQDWENPKAKGQAPFYLSMALDWLDLNLRGGFKHLLAQAIEVAMRHEKTKIREQVVFAVLSDTKAAKDCSRAAVSCANWKGLTHRLK